MRFSSEFEVTLHTKATLKSVDCLTCTYDVRENFSSEFIEKNPTRYNRLSKFIIPYLYEAQHVSGDTPPIIRSLKLHWQPLVLHAWRVVGRIVAGRCKAVYVNHLDADSVQQLHVQQPSTHAKPEAASAVLGS